MLLEVIATNLADAIAADQSGADRIRACYRHARRRINAKHRTD